MKTRKSLIVTILSTTIFSVNAQTLDSLIVTNSATIKGYTTLEQYATLKNSAGIYKGLDVYTGEYGSIGHIELKEYNGTTTFGVFSKPGFTLPLNLVSSEFHFREGNVFFEKSITVSNGAYIHSNLVVFPNPTAPLNITIESAEDYTPTISSKGKDGFYGSMNLKATQFNFEKGKVGIGVANPEAELHISGKILCNGEIEVAEVNTQNIKANEITVDMHDVADYVFENDYDLKELSEVEAYIKEHKHLPGIPSAKEIESNGVNISEMTNLLLEKVEELTLHMIQLEKENKALKEEIKDLKK